MVGKHTAVSLRHAHLLEVLLKRAGQKQTHMETQDWSTVQVFRLRDFNNAPTCCLCHDVVALWTSEHCCLYLKSGRIKLRRVSSNLQKLKNITSLIKKTRSIKITYYFLCLPKIPQNVPVTHQVMQLVCVRCVLLSLLLPLKGSVCICELSCLVLLGTLSDQAFSLLMLHTNFR